MKLTEKQQFARIAILRDVVRSGGKDRWSHLHSHGHHFKQVMACVHRGDLKSSVSYEFEITDAGRAALASTEGAKR